MTSYYRKENMNDICIAKYPFFIRIIENMHNLIDPNDDDLDMSMLFIYLYWYSCKLLKSEKSKLTHENIYSTMESLFKDHQSRKYFLKLFKQNMRTIQN